MSPTRGTAEAGSETGTTADRAATDGTAASRIPGGTGETTLDGAARMSGVREPRQRRSLETFERLVSEAEAMLVEGGPGAVTVHELVDRAGSSVGSFYARFDGRDTVLRYVQDRFWRDAAERWNAYFAGERARGGPAVAALARLTRLLVRSTSADRRRLRAFLRLALAEPELGLLERTTTLDDRIVEGATRLFAGLLDGGGAPEAPSVRTPSPEADGPGAHPGVREAIRCILAAVRDAVLFRRPTPAEERRLILTLVRMAAAGMGISGPPASYADLLDLCRPT